MLNRFAPVIVPAALILVSNSQVAQCSSNNQVFTNQERSEINRIIASQKNSDWFESRFDDMMSSWRYQTILNNRIDRIMRDILPYLVRDYALRSQMMTEIQNECKANLHDDITKMKKEIHDIADKEGKMIAERLTQDDKWGLIWQEGTNKAKDAVDKHLRKYNSDTTKKVGDMQQKVSSLEDQVSTLKWLLGGVSLGSVAMMVLGYLNIKDQIKKRN